MAQTDVPCDQIGGMGEALALGVDDEVDVALPEERRHPWRHAGRPGGSRACGTARPARAASASSAANSTNSTPEHADAVGHVGAATARCAGSSRATWSIEIDQRAPAVDRDRLRRAAAELVVEDLERQIAIIAGRRHRAHEVLDRQVALARHVAEVPAPVEQVHVDQRRIGELHDEDLVAAGSRGSSPTSILRASVWKESRIRPTFG